MRRRDFIIGLAGGATFPFVARAQQPERTRRIGVLMLYPENDPQGQLRATTFHRLNRARCRYPRARPAPIPASSETLHRPAQRLLADVDVSF
jgi:hypothetical protein